MTYKELSKLDADVQEEYIEEGIRRTQSTMAHLKDTIDLPYPENLIKFTFGKRTKILQPTETFWDEFVERRISQFSTDNAAQLRKTVEIIFQQRGTIEMLSEAVDLIAYSAANLPLRLARILRDPRQQLYLSRNGYIERIADSKEEEENV